MSQNSKNVCYLKSDVGKPDQVTGKGSNRIRTGLKLSKPFVYKNVADGDRK